MITERPSFDDYFIGIARAVAVRGDCLRKRIGAVIVKNQRVVSTGYNGTPPGSDLSCLSGDCPRGRSDLPHGVGGSYEECINLHAEQNAIAFSSHHDTVGATIYIAAFDSSPVVVCDMCRKLILAAGISRIVVA